MKRWNKALSADRENEKIDAFLKDVIDICKKHGLAISHEDKQGSFEVVKLPDGDLEWLVQADDDTGA